MRNRFAAAPEPPAALGQCVERATELLSLAAAMAAAAPPTDPEAAIKLAERLAVVAGKIRDAHAATTPPPGTGNPDAARADLLERFNRLRTGQTADTAAALEHLGWFDPSCDW